MILLQIVTAPDPVSAAIRFSTRSWASHAEFYDTESDAALGAKWDGVKLRPMRQLRYSRVERFLAPGAVEAYRWALKQTGKSYDYSAIVGIALDRDWRDPGRWFCSELVAMAFEQAAFPLLNPAADVWRITPRDLLLSPAILHRAVCCCRPPSSGTAGV